mgnify:CR=1 FL=1
MKKILKWVAIVFALLLVIGMIFNNDEEESSEKQSVKNASKNDLAVSDFKLNKSISNALSMLRSKGWEPGDGEDGECLLEYSPFLSGYGYEKIGGTFEGYRIPFVDVGTDEYGKLANYKVIITVSIPEFNSDGSEDLKTYIDSSREKTFNEVVKKCLLNYGYDISNDESEIMDGIFGFRNKGGDFCRMKIGFQGDYIMTFTFNYVSARFRNEEKLANQLLHDYYGH